MKIGEKIKSKIKVEEGVLVPNRSEKELLEAEKSRSILEQEYVENDKHADYESIDITDLEVSGAIKKEDIDVNSIRHTDIILLNGIKHNVVAAKATSEVLDTLVNGKYQAITFYVNMRKSDAENLEGKIRPFLAPPMNIPKGRKALNVEGPFIVVSPEINGFKITALMEILDEQSYDELVNACKMADNLQAYYLCKTLRGLNDAGVDLAELVKSQASVGLVANARKSLERRLAQEESTDGKILITKDIRNRSRQFADKLNEDLQLIPLTRSTFEMGFQVYTLEVSTDPNRKSQWLSSRNNLSYFQKGAAQGRIERIVGNRRTVPVLTEDMPDVVKHCTAYASALLPIMENICRRQLNLPVLDEKYKFPDLKPDAYSIVDLFNLDPREANMIAANLSTRANKAVIEETKSNKVKTISTVLGNLYNSMFQKNSSILDAEADNSNDN